ncbi:MAG: hypothetical protein HKN77_09880 [Woeseiaceae bacterium]|nr:hypothetical protein [Woeseiaceae bacterium]
MLRDVIGAIVGVAVAVLTVMLFEWISHTIFPVPAGLEVNNTAAMSEYISTVPIAAMLLVVAGYIVATFDGTFIAAWIGNAKPFIFALVVGVLMLVATVSTLIMIPHPIWFNIASVVGIIVAAWMATIAVPATMKNKRDAP